MSILVDVKTFNGIQATNPGFDKELVVHLNGIGAELVQIGVDEFFNYAIDENSTWPVFPNTTMEYLVKLYFGMKTKIQFDPAASETIMQAITKNTMEIQGRIKHEVDEVDNAVP